MSNENDLLFGEEDFSCPPETHEPEPVPEEIWKILMVDDDAEVHSVTKWVLADYSFDGRPIRLDSAFSAAEARELLSECPDYAVVFLDVVMEDDSSGLRLAHYIRRELDNRFVRIVLRTGQPGQAPEREVMHDYDINDYREKTELTAIKLFTALTSALRSYRDLTIIEENRRGLAGIIESLASIYEIKSMSKLASGALVQLVSILHLRRHAAFFRTSGIALTQGYEMQARVLAATGAFEEHMGKDCHDFLPDHTCRYLEEAFASKQSIFLPDRFIAYFESKRGIENLIYMEGVASLNQLDRDLIEVFCINLSTAFDNIMLNEEITETQKEIIFTLGEVAEARSHETGQHIKRIAEYACMLGRRCELDEDQIYLLGMASSTHDVGKLAIPDLILNKPGKLTEEEFKIIKTHSQIGHDMLCKSDRDILRTGAMIALQHHERWDGKGYPAGLQGEEIHIFSRIVSIADVFDALANERVYKKAWPLDEIIIYFQEQRGRQFDPRLVDLFLASIDEVKYIVRNMPDHL